MHSKNDHIHFQLVAPDLDRCQTVNTAVGGVNAECPYNMVVVGRCGSGAHPGCLDNGKYYTHQTVCCPLKRIGWPLQ